MQAPRFCPRPSRSRTVGALAMVVVAGCAADDPRAPRTDVAAALGISAPVPASAAHPADVEAEIERLGSELGSEDALKRQAAEDALAAYGEVALPRLDILAANADAEVAARARTAAARIRLGDALWLADIVEANWRKAASNPLNQVSPVDWLVARLREPLDLMTASPGDFQRLLDELSFAGKYMNDPEREARIDAVLEAHPSIPDQVPALMAETEKDPDFLDKRYRRAVAEVASIYARGLRAPKKECAYMVLRVVGSSSGLQALLVLPALSETAQSHADAEVRSSALRYMFEMLAEGTEYARGAPDLPYPGPAPHVSRLAGEFGRLLSWLLDLAKNSSRFEDRQIAIRTLGHLGNPSIEPDLESIFRNDPHLRPEALGALVTLGAPGARRAVLEALGNPRDRALATALHAAVRLGMPEAHDAIVAVFDDPGRPESAAAAISMAALARPGDLPRLLKIANGWSMKSRMIEITPVVGAILRLAPGESPDRRALSARFEEMLKSESGSVRLAAACVLESFDRNAGVRAWAALLDDRALTEGALQLPISWTAIGALERLTGIEFRGKIGAQTKSWQEWWKEHRGEFEGDDPAKR